MTSALVPMMTPDGEIGDIPKDRVSDAQRAGFKLGAELEKDGQIGVVPVDRVMDAIKAGFKLRSAPALALGAASLPRQNPIASEIERRQTAGLAGVPGGAPQVAPATPAYQRAVGIPLAATAALMGAAVYGPALASSPVMKEALKRVAKGAAEGAGIGAAAKYFHLFEPRK